MYGSDASEIGQESHDRSHSGRSAIVLASSTSTLHFTPNARSPSISSGAHADRGIDFVPVRVTGWNSSMSAPEGSHSTRTVRWITAVGGKDQVTIAFGSAVTDLSNEISTTTGPISTNVSASSRSSGPLPLQAIASARNR